MATQGGATRRRIHLHSPPPPPPSYSRIQQPFQGPPNPVQRLVEVNRAMPLSAKIRWAAIGIWIVGFLAVTIVFGILQHRDINRQNDLEAKLDLVLQQHAVVQGLVTALGGPPSCTVLNTTVITSEFQDAQFAVFDSTEGDDDSARIQFNLTAVPSMTTVLWTFEDPNTDDRTEVLAYLDEIPAADSEPVFADDEFAVRNALDPSKEMMLGLAGLSGGTLVILSVPDQSGTIALLEDLSSQPTVYTDDVFAIQHAGDNTREVMFDVSQVTSDRTSVLSFPDTDGTILLLENLMGSAPPYTDLEFVVFQDGDPTATARLDLSSVSADNNVTLTVPAESGTVAYLENLPQIVEVTVNTSRDFPDPGFEAVGNLTLLGTIQWIEVSVCGGGGGGGSGAGGGGGGSGSGHSNFRIYNPGDKFYRFSCTIGAGGVAGTGGMSGGDGNTTTLRGVSIVDSNYFLNLAGHGGGGGQATTSGGAAGGAGGGGGSGAAGVVPGGVGIEGGLAGGLGGLVLGPETFTDGQRGEISLTWRAGGGGSAATAGSPNTTSLAAAWNGGFATNDTGVCDGSTGCGAASMFGPGGVGSAADPAAPSYCAGGGSGGAGGSGACFFRYYLVTTSAAA